MPILSALLLAAASPAPPAVPANAATLIVYRAYAEPILFAPTLMIDGDAFGSFRQKRLLAFALSPGKHRIEAIWPPFSAQRSSELGIVVRPGQQAFVELRAAAGYLRRKGVSALIEHDEATGAAAMACCRPPR
jgi:hypothetical protein